MTIPSIRPTEEVVERFGVSRWYITMLIGTGLLVLVVTGILWMVFHAQILEFAQLFGLLANLMIGAFLAVPILFGVSLMLRALYVHLSYDHYLTTERIVERIGVFSSHTVSAEYNEITNLTVDQDFISQYLLKTGNLLVNTAGSEEEEIMLVDIDDPLARREQIRQLAHAARSGRRITSRLVKKYSPQTFDGEARDIADEPGNEGIEGASGSQTGKDNETAPISLDADTRHGVVGTPTSKAHVQRENGELIKHMYGDEIDESDRLRNAQKKL